MSKMTAKKIGANLSITIDGERKGKKVTKEEGKKMVELVNKYNTAVDKNRAKKTLDSYKKKIVDFMTSKTKAQAAKAEAKKTAKKAVTKKVSKTAKKAATKKSNGETKLLKELEAKMANGSVTTTELAAMQKLINKHRKEGEKKVATVGRGRRNEY